jgi:hypothetical protein
MNHWLCVQAARDIGEAGKPKQGVRGVGMKADT